jgi:hypothetical protein
MRKDDGLLDGASGTGREIDRRTIAKGVAWTVPVVIVATAAPAAAASLVTSSVSAPKSKGNYEITLNVQNGRATNVSVQILTLYKTGTTANLITATTEQALPGSNSFVVYTRPANAKGEGYDLSFKIATDDSVTLPVTLN